MAVFDGGQAAALTTEQQQRLDMLVRAVCKVGHGDVVIRVERGLPRFISVRIEDTFDPHRADSNWMVVSR